MEIKFKESGFCGSLEESYVASNGRLITEDYVKNLFTKKKMTDDELHDLLTWNTAAHLELHAFMIEERRIAASKRRWLWHCTQHSVLSTIRVVRGILGDRVSGLPAQLLFWFWMLLPVLMAIEDPNSLGWNPLEWHGEPIGLIVGVTLFYIIPFSFLFMKGFTAGGMGLLQSMFIHHDNVGAFRPWFGKDRNGDGWVDGRYVDFVNPEFHRYIENMYSYTSGEFDPQFTADMPLGWLVDPNSKQWGEPIKGAQSMEDYWRLRSGWVNESLGIPEFWATIHEFLEDHDLGYLKDPDDYPFYATLADSIAFHEHYLNYKLREFEAFLRLRGTEEYSKLWLSFGTNDKVFMSRTYSNFFFSDYTYGRPTFDPRPGYEDNHHNKKLNRVSKDVARYLDWLPSDDLRLAARALGISTSMKDDERLKEEILELEVRTPDSSLSSLAWHKHPLYPKLLPWHQRTLFRALLIPTVVLAQIGLICLTFVLPLWILSDPSYDGNLEALTPSFCGALFIIAYLYGRFRGPKDHQAEYIKSFLK